MDYPKLMLAARKHNRSCDAVDGGLVALPFDMQVATAMLAIECGIKTDDWNSVAQGQAMLEDLLAVMPRTRSKRPPSERAPGVN